MCGIIIDFVIDWERKNLSSQEVVVIDTTDEYAVRAISKIFHCSFLRNSDLLGQECVQIMP